MDQKKNIIINDNVKKKNTIEVGNVFQQVLIVFIILKLVPGTDVNNWSWLWILSPFWIPFGIAFLYYFIMNIGRNN